MTRLTSALLFVFLVACFPQGGVVLPIYNPPPLPKLVTSVVTITSPTLGEVIVPNASDGQAEVLIVGTYAPTLSGAILFRIDDGEWSVWVEDPHSSGGFLPYLSITVPIGTVQMEIALEGSPDSLGTLSFQVSPLNLTSPKPGQMFQREDGTGFGSVIFEGSYGPNTGAPIEGRFAGGEWQILVPFPDPAGGDFRVALDNQPSTRGWAEVRVQGLPESALSIPNVAVGWLIAIAGQSNAVGRGGIFNDYLTPEGFPDQKLFTYTVNRYWKEGGDPLHPLGGGSPYPRLAQCLGTSGVPVGFIQASEDGTGLVNYPDWKGGTGAFFHRLVDMVAEATSNTMKVGAILWFQGEMDASFSTGNVPYREGFVALAEALQNEFGTSVKVVPALQWIPPADTSLGYQAEGYQNVRLATIEAVAIRPDLFREGPETADLPRGDGLHIGSEESMELLAQRWCEILQTLLD